MSTTAREHLLEVTHCKVVAECLDQPEPKHQCARVLLSQWDGRTTEERLAHWRRFHQLPTPWAGHLATAPLLFVSSNPALGGSLPDDVATAGSKKHWITTETPNDEVVNRYEGALDEATATQAYWSSIRRRAQELFDEPVVPGTHYALTEVVRCPSVNEEKGDVLTAARFCHRKWLMPTLEVSCARVVIGVGAHAKRTLPKLLPGLGDASGVHEVEIAGRVVLVSFLPGPRSGKPKTFETTHSAEDRERLRTALRRAID
jgi:hypothetical protein